MDEQDFLNEFANVMNPRYVFESEDDRLLVLLGEAGMLRTGKAPEFVEEIFRNRQRKYQATERSLNKYGELLRTEEDPERQFIYSTIEKFLSEMIGCDKDMLLAAHNLHKRFQNQTYEDKTSEETE